MSVNLIIILKLFQAKKEIAQAIKLLDPTIKTAIDDTYKRVKDWHLKQKPKDIYYKDKLENNFITKIKLLEVLPVMYQEIYHQL